MAQQNDPYVKKTWKSKILETFSVSPFLALLQRVSGNYPRGNLFFSVWKSVLRITSRRKRKKNGFPLGLFPPTLLQSVIFECCLSVHRYVYFLCLSFYLCLCLSVHQSIFVYARISFISLVFKLYHFIGVPRNNR